MTMTSNNISAYTVISMTEGYTANTTTEPQNPYHHFQQVLDRFVTTAICILGCIGNLCNMVVLGSMKKRRMDGNKDNGTSTGLSTGLLTLAVSDMMFCIVLLPRGFLSSQKAVFSGPTFWLYYQAYGTWLVTTFILTSTCIIVTIASIRYLAICHPLHSKRYLGGRWFSKIAYFLAFALGVALNIPSMWQYNIDMLTDDLYMLDIGMLDLSSHEGHIYQWVRAITAIFIPALILLFCNLSLISALRKSRRMRKGCHAKDTSVSNRVTSMLIAIATMFIVLVFPSELMDFIYGVAPQSTRNTHIVLLMRSITNILQVINFSFNFILYCILNVHFRKILWECIRPRRETRETSSDFEKQWIRLSRQNSSITKPAMSRITILGI